MGLAVDQAHVHLARLAPLLEDALAPGAHVEPAEQLGQIRALSGHLALLRARVAEAGDADALAEIDAARAPLEAALEPLRHAALERQRLVKDRASQASARSDSGEELAHVPHLEACSLAESIAARLDRLEQQAADQDVAELQHFTALRAAWRSLDTAADALAPSGALVADHATAVAPIPVRAAADAFDEEHREVERAFHTARDVALREKSLDCEVQRMRQDIVQEEKYLQDARKASAANRAEAELLAQVVDEGKAVVAAAEAARSTTEGHLIAAESFDARAEKVGDLWADAGDGAERVDRMQLAAKGIEAHYIHLLPQRKKFEAKVESCTRQMSAWKVFREKMAAMDVAELLMRPSPQKKAANKWMSKALNR